jgi:hypothetical protein
VSDHPYQNAQAVLTSKHHKLSLFQEPFLGALGMRITEEPLDTDLLGTFTGDVERTASPLETAITKARMGINATGIGLGFASEGSIGADPIIPWIPCDIEVVVLVDEARNLVISETFKSNEIIAASITSKVGDDISEFLVKADFPRHALIVRSTSQENSNAIKGITDHVSLEKAIAQCAGGSIDQSVRIENDHRAMFSPSRRSNISKAVQLLLARVEALCPECGNPGWGKVGYQRGVTCEECGELNPEMIKEEILGCSRCEFTTQGAHIRSSIGAALCYLCNP